MKSFTYGLTPEDAIREAVAEYPDRGKYPMRLNVTDLLTVLAALHEYAEQRGMSEPDNEQRENALMLRSDILQTLGIEEV